MKITLTQHQTSALAAIELAPGEELFAEPGSLRLLGEGITARTWLGRRYTPGRSWLGRAWDGLRGFGWAVARWLWRAERAFFRVYRAGAEASRLVLAPLFPGEISRYDVGAAGLWFHAGSFLACGSRVRLSPAPGAGPLRRAEGEGALLLSGFGSIDEIEVAGRFASDVERVVAIDPALHFQLRPGPAGALVELFGEGRLWVQSGKPSRAFEVSR